MPLNVSRILTALAEQQMTVTTLAKRSGVSRQNISTILRRGTCRPVTAGKLAGALGLDVAEVVKEVA